jgi:hypothetical protein
MYAIKFEADVHNGMIAIPEEYRNLESQHLEIVALVANNSFVPKMQEKSSDIYKALEQLNADMGGNDYLTFKLKNLSKTHLYVTTKIDDELLYEALKEKHG